MRLPMVPATSTGGLGVDSGEIADGEIPDGTYPGSADTLAEATKATRQAPALPVLAFLVATFAPWVFQFGPLALTPYRLVLLIIFVPCAYRLFSGKVGRLRAADFAILGYCIWVFVSLSRLHGLEAAQQPAGIMLVETVGAYALGRCYIRNSTDYRNVISAFFWCVALLMPFAAIEAVTDRSVIRELFALVAPIQPSAHIGARWGLTRVQAVFDHPILFGVVCGCILAPVHLVLGLGRSAYRRWSKSLVVGLTAFLSMSSGPLSALTAQILLLAWNWVLRANPNRWKILWAGIATGWITISAVSNQSVPAFLMAHFAFDGSSAYYRILIWVFGTQSVMNHPLLGVGLGAYDHPGWMTSSVDMFWLYHAIFYGLPGGVLMMTVFLGNVLAVSRARCESADIRAAKTSYLIMMAGFFLVGWTVHFWNATYVLFLFLLASGAWIADAGTAQTGSSRPPQVAGVSTHKPDRGQYRAPRDLAGGNDRP